MTKAGGRIPNGILTSTGIASIATGPKSSLVYFQDRTGYVVETLWWEGKIAGYSQLFKAKLFTPLAVISWDHWQHIRIYCLADDNQLLEFCYSSAQSSQGWTPGDLHTQHKFYATPTSKLAAVCWGDNLRIRLYYQDASSDAIQELVNDKWGNGHTFPKAITGSSLAAVMWVQDGVHIRLYYQDTDLALREHRYHKGWTKGPVRPDHGVYPPPKMGPIAALQWLYPPAGERDIRVYWQDMGLFIRGWSDGGSRGMLSEGTGVGMSPHTPFTRLSAILWQPAKNIRIYYQGTNDAILEKSFGPLTHQM